MKKNVAKLGLLLCIIMVLVLSACSGSNNANEPDNTPAVTETPAAETPTETPAEPEKKEIQKVRFSEVIRSIFYAPHYIAMENGFFKDEGIEIDMNTAQGSDKGAAALIAGTADISLVGPETTIFIFNQKGDKTLKVFQQLTATDGSFLMSREKIDSFKWSDLEGKTVLGWRPGSAPQMVLNSLLIKNNMSNVEVITNVASPAMPGAFASGQGDFIQVFEPVASTLEQSGAAHFVASMGTEIGRFPETSYVAETEFIKENPEIIRSWIKAVQKGTQWIIDNTPEDAAKLLAPYFEGSSEADIINSVKRYKEQDTWITNPEMTEEQFTILQSVLLENELITEDQKVTLQDITDMTIAKEVGEGVN